MISNIKDIKFKGFTIGNNEKFTLIANKIGKKGKGIITSLPFLG